MNKSNSSYLLWLIAILCVIAAVISIPSKKELNHYQQQLTEAKQQTRNLRNDKAPIVDNQFNEYRSEQESSRRLADGIKIAVGGIHSDNDLNNNKEQLITSLGKNLANTLVSYSKDPNTGDWIIKQNDGVDVAFGKMSKSHHIPVIVVTKFTMESNDQATYLIKINYDLEQQKVISSQKVVPLTQSNMNFRGVK